MPGGGVINLEGLDTKDYHIRITHYYDITDCHIMAFYTKCHIILSNNDDKMMMTVMKMNRYINEVRSIYNVKYKGDGLDERHSKMNHTIITF